VDLDDLRSRLPMHLRRLRRTGHREQLPREPPPIAPVFAASRRFDLSQVDFFIDSFVLGALATGNFSGKKFTVQQWNGIVMILHQYDSSVDLAQHWFQFERLLTGSGTERMDQEANHVGHLQVMRLGNFSVLAAAPASVVDDQQRLVELDVEAKPVWPKLIFRMMTLGCESLQHGVIHGDVLRKIDSYDIWQLIDKYSVQERARFAISIVDALSTIRTLVGTQQTPFALDSWSTFGSPTLLPLPAKRSLLPTADVMERLFPGSAEAGGDTDSFEPRRIDSGR